MMANWFKLSDKMIDDRQIKYIALRLKQPRAVAIGVWTMLLSYTNDTSQPGKLAIGDFPLESLLSQESGLDSDLIAQFIHYFIEFGMLDCANGFLAVANWGELYQAPANWNLSKFREQVFRRDSICVYCGSSPECLDHIIPRSKGGQNQLNNLVACCNRCNHSKYDYDMEEWYRAQPFFRLPRLEYIKCIMRQKVKLDFLEIQKT